MLSITITDLRTKIRKLADLVAFKGERIRVERNGETAFVLVSEEDAALLEALEDRKDIKAAKKALKESYSISLDELEKEGYGHFRSALHESGKTNEEYP